MSRLTTEQEFERVVNKIAKRVLRKFLCAKRCRKLIKRKEVITPNNV